MNTAELTHSANLIKDAGEKCAIAAGGFAGMANAVVADPPSAEQDSELCNAARKVVEAAPTAAQHFRDCADAIERLGNLLWATLHDSGVK